MSSAAFLVVPLRLSCSSTKDDVVCGGGKRATVSCPSENRYTVEGCRDVVCSTPAEVCTLACHQMASCEFLTRVPGGPTAVTCMRDAGAGDVKDARGSVDAGDANGDVMSQTCADILSAWTAFLRQVDRTCSEDSDCILVGDSDYGCEPQGLGPLCGEGVRRSAYAASAGPGIVSDFSAARCRPQGLYDCGRWLPACRSGRCTAYQASPCFDLPPADAAFCATDAAGCASSTDAPVDRPVDTSPDLRDGAAPCTGVYWCLRGDPDAGSCGDNLQPGICENGAWHCPPETIEVARCRCTGFYPGCSCGDAGWVCPRDGGSSDR